MQIIEKIKAKQEDLWGKPSVTIAFLGDSVTQGCFEVYWEKTHVQTVFNQHDGYHSHLAKLLSTLYPSVPFNIINAGISGMTAPQGLARLEQDVLSHNPDLVVVCFGLNDAMTGSEYIENYTNALEQIFLTLRQHNIEAIFMTPNMMCTEISDHLTDPRIIEIAEAAIKIQNGGILRMYLEAAKQVCQKCEIPVCDCYQKWELMHSNGVRITELLSNKINHPTKEMNWIFAVSLMEQMLR